MRRRISTLTWILVLAAFLTAGCALTDKNPPRIASLALATQIDPTSKAPITTVEQFPQNTKVMYLSVRVESPRKGTRLESKWYYDKQGQGGYALVDSSAVTFPSRGDRYVAFSLTATDQFPPGAYKVTLLLDGQEVQQKEYRVQ